MRPGKKSEEELQLERSLAARRPCKNAGRERDSYFGEECDRMMDRRRSHHGFQLCEGCSDLLSWVPYLARTGRDFDSAIKKAETDRRARIRARYTPEAARKAALKSRKAKESADG